MTTYLGNSGVVKVGSTAIAELTRFSVTVTEGTVEDSAQGDTAHTYLADGMQGWTASVEGHYFPGDTGGQDQIVEGASLSLVFNPIGTTTGRQKLSGTGIVTSVAITSENVQVVNFTAQFQGSGTLTRGAN